MTEQEIPVRRLSDGRKYHRLAIDEDLIGTPGAIVLTVKFVIERMLACPTGSFSVKRAEKSKDLWVTQYEPKDGK